MLSRNCVTEISETTGKRQEIKSLQVKRERGRSEKKRSGSD